MNMIKQIFLKLSVFLIALSFSILGNAEKLSNDQWKNVIPVMGKTIQADIMELRPSDEFAKLAAKMEAGLKKNPEWALEFASAAPKGQPLPYHENLGLTKQEYERMQELTQQAGALSLRKLGTIDITFVHLKNGRVKIVTKTESMLNNLILSAKAVETSFGKLTNVSLVESAKTAKAVTGPWSGIRWSINTVNQQAMEGQSIQFAIGKRENSEYEGVIYYDGKVFKGSSTPPVQFTQILFFPLTK